MEITQQYNELFLLYNEEHDFFTKADNLLNALLSNNGLQFLIDEAYRLLKFPIFVVDANYKYIATNIGLANDDSAFSKLMRQENEQGYIIELGMDYIKLQNLDEKIRFKGEPYYFFNELMQCGQLVGAVRVHGIEVAHLAMAELDGSFSHSDYLLFSRLLNFVAQELQKSAFYQENKGQMFSYLLKDLIETEHPNHKSIERRLKTLEYKLKEAFQVLVISGEGTTLSGLELFVEQIQHILTNHIYVFYKNELVIFLNKKSGESSSYFIEELQKTLLKNGCIAGISNEFFDICAIRKFYLQAMRTVSICKQKSENKLFWYRDIVLTDMLEICKTQRELIELCHPKLLKLLDYDKDGKLGLADTLYCYLQTPANPQKIAEQLYIHRNTYFYRIDNIKNIMNSDLKDGEELFLFHLSFQVLKYLGLYASATAKADT